MAPAPFDQLSDRQLAAITLLATGATNAQIGDRLCKAKTVESHLNAAKSRIGMWDRAAIARLAIRVGLVSSAEEDDFALYSMPMAAEHTR